MAKSAKRTKLDFDEIKRKFLHLEDFYELKEAFVNDDGIHKYVFSCQKCLPLKKTYSSHSGAPFSNLKNHIEKCHASILSKYLEARNANSKRSKESQSTNNSSEVQEKPNIFANRRILSKDDVKNVVCQYIIDRNEPFTLVNDEGFQNLVHKFQPSAVIPTYRVVVKTISKQYEDMITRIKDELASAEFVAFSTDGWTCVNKTYLGYTMTWLDEDFKRKIIVIACRRHVGRKTYEQVGKHMLDILREFGVQHKIVGGTTDGAGEYKKAFREFKLKTDQTDPESENDEEKEYLDEIEVQMFNINEALANKDELSKDLELPFQVIMRFI